MEMKQLSWKETLLSTVAWFAACVLLIVDTLNAREALLKVLNVIQANRAAAAPAGSGPDIQFGFFMESIDRGFLFVGGVIAVAFAVAIEYYFRRSENAAHLFKRILVVFGVEVAVLLVFWAVILLTR